MRISDLRGLHSRGMGLAVAVVAALALAVPAALVPSVPSAMAGGSSRPMPFKSPQAAYEHGMSAWRSGYIENAVPALAYAAQGDVFLAKFYLARIYAESGTAWHDPAAAYRLYQQIANEFTDIDPDDDQRAPFVAKAMTALAVYLREGLPQANVQRNQRRAVEIFKHAAQWFNNEDAQFELAKMQLKGEGVQADPRTAMHYLSVLTQRGHAGAQAFLADIYWRGRYNVQRDQLKAFALISVAVENASDSERLWIEDIYQNIYCGSPASSRQQAQGIAQSWQRKYGRSVTSTDRFGLGVLPPKADRTCGNGEAVTPLLRDARAPISAPSTASSLMHGSVMGIGITRSEPANR